MYTQDYTFSRYYPQNTTGINFSQYTQLAIRKVLLAMKKLAFSSGNVEFCGNFSFEYESSISMVHVSRKLLPKPILFGPMVWCNLSLYPEESLRKFIWGRAQGNCKSVIAKRSWMLCLCSC